jgi:hypothetical protein
MPNKPIFVVRQESLLQNWMELEAFLRGGPAAATAAVAVPSIPMYEADSRHYVTGKVSSTLSKEATRNLCCALLDELAIYQALIERAENLSDLEKQHALAAAPPHCGVASWQELQPYCPS